MNVRYGEGRTEYGPGVRIELDSADVYHAIQAYLAAHAVDAIGPQTFRMGADGTASIYVDPSGFVRLADGREMSGRGPG